MLRRALALLAIASSGALHAQTLPLSACKAPVHSPEAKRYELQGTTRLAFNVDQYGMAASISVARSSGWKLLDAESVKLAATCRFRQPEGPGTLDVPWVLAPETLAPVRPVLKAAACKSSALFKPVEAGQANDTLLVRLQVWADGQIYGPKLDTGSGDEKIDRAAIAFVQSCSYTPAESAGVAVQSAAVLRLALAKDLLEEPHLRTLYERMLPRARKLVAGRKEYQIRFLVKNDEAEARAAHASIRAGETFDAVQKRVSPSLTAASSGLGKWMLPKKDGNPVAEALHAASTPGLLPSVIKGDQNWVVLQIDAIRPAEPVSYEVMLPYLKASVLAGVDLNKAETPNAADAEVAPAAP